MGTIPELHELAILYNKYDKNQQTSTSFINFQNSVFSFRIHGIILGKHIYYFHFATNILIYAIKYLNYRKSMGFQ